MFEEHLAKEDEVLYHVGLSRKMLEGATIAILPGDPGRVQTIAEAIGEAKPVAVHREYTSYLCYVKGVPVLVCSTGMGGPSVAIGVEELSRLGLTTFIRLGTTGSLQEELDIGDIVINDSAVRLEGTSLHYAPLSFPAVADHALTLALLNAAKRLNVSHACGTTVSSDTFWQGQERYDSYTGYIRKDFRDMLKEWQMLGCTNMEMEAATLFVQARIFRKRAGCVCAVIAKRTKSEAVAEESVRIKAVQNAIAVVKETLNELVSAPKG